LRDDVDEPGWLRHADNPILEKGGPGDWDDAKVNWPYVIKVDSMYYMYYMGNSEIGLATSPDGEVFTRITDGIGGTSKVLAKGGSGAWDEMHVTSPAVIKLDGTWYMFYTGRDLNGTTYECIGVATSSDGKNWSKNGGNPILSYGGVGWRERHLCHADAAWDADNNRWVLLVSGMDGSGHERIGRYYCTDADFPDTWTEDPGNPVINYGTQSGIDGQHVYHPRIYPSKVGGVWYIYYTAADGLDVNLTICYANTSSLYDGSFTKNSNNPVLTPGDKSWEINEVYTAALKTKIDVDYYLYYSGKDSGGIAAIGLATCQDISLSHEAGVRIEDSSQNNNDGIGQQNSG